MHAALMPRRPAPVLACGAMWLRLGVGPNALGNVIGDALAAAMGQSSGRRSYVDPDTGEHIVVNDTMPKNDFASINAVAASALRYPGNWSSVSEVDRSGDVFVASNSAGAALPLGAGVDVIRFMGSLPKVTVYANEPLIQDGWIREDVLDGMSSFSSSAGDVANKVWQAYSGAMAGEFNAIKDAAVGVGSRAPVGPRMPVRFCGTWINGLSALRQPLNFGAASPSCTSERCRSWCRNSTGVSRKPRSPS